MHDDDDDRPTKAECDAEANEAAARESLRKQWHKDFPRHSEVLDNAENYHPHLTKLIAALESHRTKYIEDGLDEQLAADADAAAEAADPYAYRGLRRSDFL